MVLCFVYTDVIARVCEKVEHSIGFVYGPCIRVHGRVQAVFTAVAVYTACTLLLQSCTWLCTRPVYTRERAMYTCARLCTYTARVEGRLCTWLVHTVRPLTRPFTGSVHGRYQAVYGPCRRPCTRPCTSRARTVSTAMYTTMPTAVNGPCTGRVHGRVHDTAMYGPCALNNN